MGSVGKSVSASVPSVAEFLFTLYLVPDERFA